MLEDIQDIQQGLNGLPHDLMNLLAAIEQRVEEIEALLASLGLSGGSGPVAPVVPVIPVSSSVADATTESLGTSTVVNSAPTPSVHMCKPMGGAGPLVPCGEPGDVTTTYTSYMTHTHLKTLTVHMPNPTGALSNATQPHLNGTGWGGPTASSTQSAQALSTDSVVAVTQTLEYTALPSSTTAVTAIPYSALSSPSPSTYTFDAKSSNNVAVYYGQTPATTTGGPLTLCQNPNVDIVILSFIYGIGVSMMPRIDFGLGCVDPSPEVTDSGPGLKNCTALAPEITECQQLGKKVLVSIGGHGGSITLTSDDEAKTFAKNLWSLFGNDSTGSDLRPFGSSVVVDGFDIDNETGNSAYWGTFASALRSYYDTDASKTYYLSAAPQCPMPDASIPLDAMQLADFVWVQFYNNPSCSLESPGFQDSFAAWPDLLSNGTRSSGPRVYVGAGATESAGSGYVEGSGLGSRVSLARELYTHNLGGIMLWDGSEGLANVDQNGVDYLEYAKAALH